MDNHAISCCFSFILTLAIVTVRGKCPPDADRQAQKCIERLMMLQQDVTYSEEQGAPEKISQRTAETVETACRQREFSRAIDCIEDLTKQCKMDTTNAAHFMNEQFDVNEMRESANFLCSNIGVYKQNIGCITNQTPNITECSTPHRKDMDTVLDATGNMDVHIQFNCIYLKMAFNCSVFHISRACGAEAKDMVATLLYLMAPPVCKNPQYIPYIPVKRVGNRDSMGVNSGHSWRHRAVDKCLFVFHIILLTVFSHVL